MKRLLSLLLCLLLCLTLLPAAALAAGGVPIDETNVPDEAFRSYVGLRFDSDGNGLLSRAEIKAAVEIGDSFDFDFPRNEVKSLKGVELLTELTALQADFCQITELDLSKNTKLSTLSCIGCPLSSLDLSKNAALKKLYCRGNAFSSLDLSGNTGLETLQVAYCGVTALDLRGLSELKSLECTEIPITRLDLSGNTKLTNLYLVGTGLSSVDVGMCPALTEDIHYNVNPTYLTGDHEIASWVYVKDSTIISLEVDRDMQVYCDPKAVVSVQPESVTAEEGSTAEFRVEAEGGYLSYQWQYRRSESGSWCNSTSAGNKTATLSVPATAARSGFQFRCKVSNGRYAKAAYSKAATLTVTVTQPPVISRQPKDANAAIGSTVSFTVKSPNSGLSYQWQYRRSPSGLWNNSSSEGAKTATLTLTATEARDGFQFRCKVRNAIGTTVSDAATLRVGRTAVITAQPESTSVGLNKWAHFSVEAEGDELSYQWQFRTDPWSRTWYNSTAASAKTPNMTVRATEARNGYQYRCKVTNFIGTVYSEPAGLSVIWKPEIWEQPYDVEIPAGEEATFFVGAEGYGLSYQWQYLAPGYSRWRNCTSDGATTEEMIVIAQTFRNGFRFRCRITNDAGTVYTEPVTLTVLPAE